MNGEPWSRLSLFLEGQIESKPKKKKFFFNFKERVEFRGGEAPC